MRVSAACRKWVAKASQTLRTWRECSVVLRSCQRRFGCPVKHGYTSQWKTQSGDNICAEEYRHLVNGSGGGRRLVRSSTLDGKFAHSNLLEDYLLYASGLNKHGLPAARWTYCP